jgi:uncharacterized RDD family membrane protein YckC
MQFLPAVTLAISIAVFLRASRHYAAARYGVSQRYATYWPRLWACLVDGFALWPLTILELLALRTGLGPRPAGASLLICAWIPWLYSVRWHALRGATLGQEICQVRLLDARSERAIGWGRAWRREAPGLAAALLCSGFILGQVASGTFRPTGTLALVLVSLFPCWTLLEIASLHLNRKHRALSDLLAGTVVVRINAEPARRAESPVAAPFEGRAA